MTRPPARPVIRPAEMRDPLDWLGKTSLQDLSSEVARRLQEARTAGIQEGYQLGYEAGNRAGDDLVRKLQADQDTSVAARIQEAEDRGLRRGQVAAEEKLRAGFDRERANWAEWKASEEKRRSDQNLKEAEERGKAFERTLRSREKEVEANLRKELEAEYQTRFQDARRKGFQEGAAEARRNSLGFEGTRTWALGVLHLNSNAATPDVVRQRYRKLSMLLHPDQNPGAGDEFIKNLTRARDLLVD